MSGAAHYRVQQRDQEAQWVEEYLPLVKRIAYHLGARLPDSVQVDDLMQAGLIGLIEAGRHFDSTAGASFETYAGIRIRGAMLDEVRRQEWLPRSVHRKARELAEVMRQLENELGNQPGEQQIAARLGLDLPSYRQMLSDVQGHRMLSIDELAEGREDTIECVADHSPGLLEGLQYQDLKRQMAKAIGSLPEREGMVLNFYYNEELNLKEIGRVLGVSESRVCQIHSQALLRLRANLQEGE